MKKVRFIIFILLFVFVIGADVHVSSKAATTVSGTVKKTSKKTTSKIKKSYKITYVLNKGTNSKKNPKKYKSAKAVKFYSPVRKGYTFKGWYTDKKYKNRIKKIKKGKKGAVKVYAKWTAIDYNITYKLDKGSNNRANVKTYNCSKTVKLYSPSRERYDFKGWYTDSALKNKVTKIKKGTTGDIILYAKWELPALNINQTGNGNMIWSWWNYPQVVSYEGTKQGLYWGYVTNEGYCGVARYDYVTGETKKTILKQARVDDHNGLAVTMMEDGRVMCAYAGGHDSDNEIHVRISDRAENIDKFSTDVVLRASGKTCYSQILQYKGKYYLFYRVGSKNWAYRSSSNGKDWTSEVILVTSTMKYYCKFMPTTEDGIIRICMCSNPTSADANIRMGFLNLDDGNLYNADNKTKLGKKNISNTKFDIIIERLQSKTQRLLDVAVSEPERPLVLFATFAKNKTSKNSRYKIYDAGTITEICQGGNPLWNPKYQCGASFIGTEKIVVAREEDDYDKIEMYSYEDGNFTLTDSVYSEEIGTIGIRNARPIVDVNGKAVLWHRGYYNQDCYTDFNTEAKIYLLD